MRISLFPRNRQRQNQKMMLWKRKHFLHIFALLSLFTMIWLAFNPSAYAANSNHTQGSVDTGCQQFTFSSDGNPFPLCPGPYPIGGNCVWWGWEEWHLLGYNLPVNWGNAADWIVDAERFGLDVGTTPRVGSLAVFPVADGVWAFGTAGHVAFVTWVSGDSQNFNVTYQNYGDTTPMYIGTGYNVSYINQARFQDGQMRFIYFPKTIDPQLFSRLPGINGNDLPGVGTANQQLDTGASDGTLAGSRVALGLPAGSYDQEFSADFTGNGYTDFLLYNRAQGRLDVLALQYSYQQYSPRILHNYLPPGSASTTESEPYRVSLHDSQTSVNGWGQNLNIYIGDFTGSGHAEILLYDLVSGQIQLLTLTPQLTIAKHVTLPGWGPGWEIYPGRFDGQHTDLLLYKRFAVPAPIATATPTTGQTPTVTPTVTARPTAKPTATPTVKPTATPTPTPTETVTPTVTPTTTPVVTPDPTPTPTPIAVPTRMPVPAVVPTPTPTAAPTPTTGSTSTTPSGAGSTTSTDNYQQDGYLQSLLAATGTGEPVDPTGKSPTTWSTSGLTADLLLVNFTKNFQVGTTQTYSLWHDSWEVYVGNFVSTSQDGIFLYDRNVGEGRLIEFTAQLTLEHFQFLHNLGGDWEVHTGDFQGQGRAQLLFYDPNTGDAQITSLKTDLSVNQQVSYTGWNTNQVLYVGHFGMPSLSIMLYDAQQAQSTFIGFDSSLNITHQFTAQSWGQTSQILIGSFLDRSLCLEQDTCSTGDDILVLNRTTGMVQQYVFSFGNQFGVYDNRSQAFLREGIATTESVLPVDATSFNLLTSLDTSIHGEELY
jgi:surface antigen